MNARPHRRTFRAFWAGSFFCLVIMVALLAFCLNTMRSVPYTLFALVLTAPIFKFLITALREQWQQKVVFDADSAICTNSAAWVHYGMVQTIRFSYWSSFHSSHKTIVLELKKSSSYASASMIVWDVGDFSMSTVAHILLELCWRSSPSSVEIKQPFRELDSDLARVLKRHGQLTRDKNSGHTIFTPFPANSS